MQVETGNENEEDLRLSSVNVIKTDLDTLSDLGFADVLGDLPGACMTIIECSSVRQKEGVWLAVLTEPDLRDLAAVVEGLGSERHLERVAFGF